jgi:hypothetical protein
MTRPRAALALALSTVLAAWPSPAGADMFVGWITDAECGADHAPMIAKGGMGKDDRECTLKCVAKGAPYGFVDSETRTFYQLDDQDAPAAFAAERVRIEGRREGDTIFVTKIEAAKKGGGP